MSVRGFTIIELLVVVTIIVVLVALLTPALSQAVYQAELTSCGAGNLKSMTTGVTTYAFENKRYYPDRGIAGRKHRDTNPLPVNPYTVKRASIEYDIRDLHRTIFPLNKTLQCPLTPKVELESDDLINDSECLDASFSMFWGWQYKHETRTFDGMFKLGDRFTYDNLLGSGINSFSVLAGDIDLVWGGEGGAQASHPDRDPSVMSPLKVEGEFFIDGRITAARWSAGPGVIERGLIDTNFAFDDGAVARYSNVAPVHVDGARRNPQLTRAPINFNNYNSTRGERRDKMHLPLR